MYVSSLVAKRKKKNAILDIIKVVDQNVNKDGYCQLYYRNSIDQSFVRLPVLALGNSVLFFTFNNLLHADIYLFEDQLRLCFCASMFHNQRNRLLFFFQH